jgi:hypothetical protein
MKGFCRFALLSLAIMSGTAPAPAASDADVDKLTTYATVLGRGIACGADVDSASRRIGAWMDKRFPPGSSDQRTYLPVFMEGTRYAAQRQKNGNSPDSCAQVLRTFASFPWP